MLVVKNLNLKLKRSNSFNQESFKRIPASQKQDVIKAGIGLASKLKSSFGRERLVFSLMFKDSV